MSDQHLERWEEYQSFDESKKREYFDVLVPYAETVVVHFGYADEKISESINASIVDVILYGLLASPNDEGEMEDQTKHFLKFNNDIGTYTLSINRRKCFNITVGHVQHGLSFRAVALILRSLRSSASLAFMANVSEGDVSTYVRALALMSLQRISNKLQSPQCWAFSIAFDGATVVSSSYIDLRVRFHNGFHLCNYPVLAIPIKISHNGANMYDVISKVLTSLCGESWKIKLIGVSTDGAANMVG